MNELATPEVSAARTMRVQWVHWLGRIALLALVVGAYWPSMRGQFLWDDDYYVTNNPALKSSSGIQDIWVGIIHPQTYPVPQYYPITHTSFWLQTRGHNWAERLESWPFHLVNVLLHVLSAWMLWGVLRKLNMPGAWVAAAIWALHPVQVESVAWITERKNVLSGFFFFASLLVYIRFCGLDEAPSPDVKRSPFSLPTERGALYGLAIILFLCSILSKSVTGSLPAVVLLLIWWKRGKLSWLDVTPLIPFFVLAAGMGAITTYMERNVVGARGPDWDFTVFERLKIAGGAVWFYAWKLICPINLAFVYERWNLNSVWLVVGLLAGIGIIVGLFADRFAIGRGPTVGALLFVGMLFPALGLINTLPMLYSYVYDHFQYLASIALISMAVAGLRRILPSTMVFSVISAAILGLLSGLTWKQNHIFQGSIALWSDTVQKSPNSSMAHNNLGDSLIPIGDGNPLIIKGDLDAAEAQFNLALALKPNNVMAKMNLGRVAEARGDIEQATSLYEQAIELTSSLRSSASFARAYFNLARMYYRLGRIDEAIDAYHGALILDSRYVAALTNLGAVLFDKSNVEVFSPLYPALKLRFTDERRINEAMSYYQKALEIDPDSISTHNNLGNALRRIGRPDEAAAQWLRVLELDKKNLIAITNLGIYLVDQGNLNGAIEMFKQARAINPNYEPAQRSLALALRTSLAATRPSTTTAPAGP